MAFLARRKGVKKQQTLEDKRVINVVGATIRVLMLNQCSIV